MYVNIEAHSQRPIFTYLRKIFSPMREVVLKARKYLKNE
jgi:hypothetical protein